jgi:cobalamin biosynthesis Mg chelatase CobN
MQQFSPKSIPALHVIAGRLPEAAQRGLWAEPSAEILQGLKEVIWRVRGAGGEGFSHSISRYPLSWQQFIIIFPPSKDKRFFKTLRIA